MRRVVLLSFLFLLAVASACRGSTPTPSPTPTASPTPAPSPTATPTLASIYTPPVNPVISQFRVQDALWGVLTVIWWTDRPTTSRLEYGLSEQYGLSTPWTEGLTTSNGASVTGLELGLYHFRVRVKDAAGNETVSEDEAVMIYYYTLPRAAQESQVGIRNSAFNPARLTIDQDTVVAWFNRDTVAHSVKGPPCPDAPLESGPLAPGEQYYYLFDKEDWKAGTYTIVCGLHPSETQEIILR